MDFKKILVAVDASDNAMRAVEYTGEMVAHLADCDAGAGFLVTLLYVERLPDRDMFPDDATWKAKCQEHNDTVNAFLDKARGLMLGKGLPEAMVETRYLVSCGSPLEGGGRRCSMGTSTAQEILRELKEGGYGTAVVGRRGVSKAEEFLFGSVSSKIIHSAKDCTVWVVA